MGVTGPGFTRVPGWKAQWDRSPAPRTAVFCSVFIRHPGSVAIAQRTCVKTWILRKCVQVERVLGLSRIV